MNAGASTVNARKNPIHGFRIGKDGIRMEKNTSARQQPSALAGTAGEFLIGGDLRVTRLGFGSMRLTGKGIWGEPENRTEADR